MPAATVFAPIGTVESLGGVAINGRPAQGKEAIWGGELIEASAAASARASLNAIGEVTLTRGTSVHLAASVTEPTGYSSPRVLIASLLSGEVIVKLQPGVVAYLEASGSVFTASEGASFRLAIREAKS